MPVVFEMYNENGKEIMDFGQAYYERSSGVSQIKTTQAVGDQALLSWGANPDLPMHYSGTALAVQAMPWPVNDFTYSTPVLDKTDMVFFQLKTDGILFGMSVEIPWGDVNGTNYAILSEKTTSMNWKRVSLTPGAPVGNVGRQKFDLDENVILDTRHKMIGIVDSFLITQAQLNDILDNNIDLVLTLSKDAPDCFVCCSYWASYRSATVTPLWVQYAKITQTAVNQLTISRLHMDGQRGAQSPYVAFTHTAIILVAR